MSVKIAWAKHLYNAYHSVKAGDSVYDSSGNLLGKADGCYARPTYKSPGSVCCLLYTSPSPRDLAVSRMPSSA